MSRKKREPTAGDRIRMAVLLVALAVFLFSGFQLMKIFLEYKQGTDEYDKIRQYVAEDTEDTGEEDSSQPEEEEKDKPVPPSVDWESLKSINPDIIGWISIEGTEISYPVVQGTDNDYYLKHTFEGTQNAAGSIFIDYMNSKSLEDCNTVVYGHNMKNGSMFGLLRKYFQDQESVPGKYIWLCTPEKNWRYEIFSSHTVAADGNVYTLFSAHDDQFQAYVEQMKAESLVDYGVAVSKEDRVITLSTCTGDYSTRFVVQARQEGAY